MIDPKDIQLTPNFKLREFLHEGSPMPAPFIIDNLYRLANRLQVLRDIYGPITINSGYRTPAHNKAVGGATDSMHLKGMAADINIKGMTPAEVQKALKNWSGGMGVYGSFTHLDIRSSKARWVGP